jgi:hypothetical protein
MNSKRNYKAPKKLRMGKVSLWLSLAGIPSALILWIWGIDLDGDNALITLLLVMPLIAILAACSLIAAVTGSIALGQPKERKLGSVGLALGILTLIAAFLGFQMA